MASGVNEAEDYDAMAKLAAGNAAKALIEGDYSTAATESHRAYQHTIRAATWRQAWAEATRPPADERTFMGGGG
jgi:hypothetical protein